MMWFEQENEEVSALDIKLLRRKRFITEPTWVRCDDEGLPPFNFYGIVQVEKMVTLKDKFTMPDHGKIDIYVIFHALLCYQYTKYEYGEKITNWEDIAVLGIKPACCKINTENHEKHLKSIGFSLYSKSDIRKFIEKDDLTFTILDVDKWLPLRENPQKIRTFE